MPAGLAWRTALIHYFRGELNDALTMLDRGLDDPASSRSDRARALGWLATVHWLRQDHERCRWAATEALALAVELDDDGALAVAHTAMALLAAMEGDQSGNVTHYRYAERAALRSGDRLALIRIWNNLGSRLLEEGRYRAAAPAFEDVIKLAGETGYAALGTLAVHNRGLANLGLGQLDEAAADFGAAVASYRELGSRTVAYPLMRLAEVHRLRGELGQARAGYEQAVAEVQAAEQTASEEASGAGLVEFSMVV
ncbi:hypothetical protein ACFQ0D_35775, partial [Micromonospora zhanjiangensis]